MTVVTIEERTMAAATAAATRRSTDKPCGPFIYISPRCGAPFAAVSCKTFAVNLEARILISILLAFGALGLSACRDQSSNAAEEPKVEVKAQVAPIDTFTVSAPFDGRVAAIRAPEGSPVNAGQVVIEVTNPAIERDLFYARAQLAAAERKLRQVETPIRGTAPNEWESTARQILDAKERKLELYRKLLESGDVSAQEVRDVSVEVAAARRDWIAERDRRMTAPERTDPALLRLEIDRAKADLAVAEDHKTQLSLTAPAAGLVSRVTAKPGDRVFAREPLLEISNASSVRVTAQIAPELVRYVRVGQLVEVQVLTIPPHRFRERIVQIIPPGSTNGPLLVVNVPNPDRMLQPGTPAMITVR
jgi:multidrug resistance efflux pump